MFHLVDQFGAEPHDKSVFLVSWLQTMSSWNLLRPRLHSDPINPLRNQPIGWSSFVTMVTTFFFCQETLEAHLKAMRQPITIRLAFHQLEMLKWEWASVDSLPMNNKHLSVVCTRRVTVQLRPLCWYETGLQRFLEQRENRSARRINSYCETKQISKLFWHL